MTNNLVYMQVFIAVHVHDFWIFVKLLIKIIISPAGTSTYNAISLNERRISLVEADLTYW